MKGLIEGRIVHYVMPDPVHVRPAIVVRAWDRDPDGGNGCANLVVLVDGSNDGVEFLEEPPLKWATSVVYDESGAPGTWHWPPKA